MENKIASEAYRLARIFRKKVVDITNGNVGPLHASAGTNEVLLETFQDAFGSLAECNAEIERLEEEIESLKGELALSSLVYKMG